MKKKIILGSIGAVLIVLMMASSATATLQHIDSNIRIKEKHLKALEAAYNSKDITNEDFKTLIGKIIDILKTKKVVTSKDVKEIIEDNNLAVGGVYFARPISGEGGGSCGPHFIRFYWGMFMFWQAKQSNCPSIPIKVTVGPEVYTSDHEGLALSYFGTALHPWGYDMNHGFRSNIILGGFGFLILVS